MGRMQSFVTVCDFLLLATCYAEIDGRLRPRGDLPNISIVQMRRYFPHQSAKLLGLQAIVFWQGTYATTSSEHRITDHAY